MFRVGLSLIRDGECRAERAETDVVTDLFFVGEPLDLVLVNGIIVAQEPSEFELLATNRDGVEPADGVVVIESLLEGGPGGDRPDDDLAQLEFLGDGAGERRLTSPRLARDQDRSAEEQGCVDDIDSPRFRSAGDLEFDSQITPRRVGCIAQGGGAGNLPRGCCWLSPWNHGQGSGGSGLDLDMDTRSSSRVKAVLRPAWGG